MAILPIALLSCVATGGKSQFAPPTSIKTKFVTPSGIPVLARQDDAGRDMPPLTSDSISASTGPSFVTGLGQRDRLRATLCLASAVYYEAANEPDEGQRAVAQVVLNRVRHREWPQTICGVVYQGSSRPGCQFSFACDGAMARGPMLAAWIRARRVAERALSGDVYAAVGNATFYHTTNVAPAWGRRMTPVAVVGAHIFYRMPGDVTDLRALPMTYVGREPHPGPLPPVAPVAELMAVTTAITTPGVPLVAASPARAVPMPPPASGDTRYVAGALPESTIREEFRDSGQWIAR